MVVYCPTVHAVHTVSAVGVPLAAIYFPAEQSDHGVQTPDALKPSTHAQTSVLSCATVHPAAPVIPLDGATAPGLHDLLHTKVAWVFWNTFVPILVTEFGMVTDVRLVHPSNASSPILVTEFGMTAETRLMDPLNSQPLISVIESGMVTVVRLLQP